MMDFYFEYDACFSYGENEYRAKDWNDAVEGIADYVAWHIDVDDDAEVTITDANGASESYIVRKFEENKNGQPGKFSAWRIYD